jgi:hypothetical protein
VGDGTVGSAVSFSGGESGSEQDEEEEQYQNGDASDFIRVGK